MPTELCQVLNSNYVLIGHVKLKREEIEHFADCGSVPAKIALDHDQMAKLWLEDNSLVYIRFDS